MKPALIFSLKVWLTALFGAPLLIAIGSYIYDGLKDPDPFSSVVLFIIYGLLFSAPSWLLLWLAAHLLLKTKLSDTNRKFILSVVGFVLTLLPFCMAFQPGFNFNTAFFVI